MRSALKQDVSQNAVVRYWQISLGIGLVVIGAVALLLSTLATIVARIETGAAEIWRVGKLIANNTVHVPLLVRSYAAAELESVAPG